MQTLSALLKKGYHGSVFTQHVLHRQGCPLHYWLAGPEGRPLVVFTHGACVDHEGFALSASLVATEYRVLNWDVRGHGRSQPMGDNFTVPLAAEDLLAIVDATGYASAIFVGHSNGSHIGQELAFRHPHRVQALVHADATCITWSHGQAERAMASLFPRVMAPLPFEVLKRSGLEMISLKKEVRDYTYRAFSQISKQDFLKIVQAVLACMHAEPRYRFARPMLLVHGDDDRMGNIRRIAPLWAAQEPDCQYAVIPRARHFAVLDNPDFFNGLLRGFLKRCAPPGPCQ